MLPSLPPREMARPFAIRAKNTTAQPLIPSKAAPIPTAKPSSDNDMAKTAASFVDRLSDASTSAASGFAYRCKISLKFNSDNSISFSRSICFLMKDFAMLSSSLISPKVIKMAKDNHTANPAGMCWASNAPTTKDIPVTPEQIMLMICPDNLGILIFLQP